MKKHRRNEHGAITVFLSMVLIFIIAFMGMLVDLARMRVAESQAKRASQLAIDAVMTEYSRKLREDYGLYGYAGGETGVNDTFLKYFNANLQPAAEKEHGEFITLIKTITGKDSVKYGDMLNLSAGESTSAIGDYPLSNPDALYQQVVEFSKFRVPITLAMSGKLSKVTQMQETLTNINNDTAAYDRINDLGEPVDEYYGLQDELVDELDMLKAAVSHMNTAVDNWNMLVDGASDVTVYASSSSSIRYDKVDPYFGSYNFISGATTYVDSASVYRDVSAQAYNRDATVNAFNSMKSEVSDEIQWLAMEEYYDAMDDQPGKLATALNPFDGVEQTDSVIDAINQIMTAYNYGSELQPRMESDSRKNFSFRYPDVQEEMLDLFERELASQTSPFKRNYEDARRDVNTGISNLKTAIANLERQGATVDNTVEQIDDDIEQRKNAGQVSENIYSDWTDGDKTETEEMRKTDTEKIEKLKEAVSKLEEDLKNVDIRNDPLNAAAVATDFMNNGVRAVLENTIPHWSGSTHQMLNVGFGGQYIKNDENQRDKYGQAREQADDLNNNKPSSDGEKEHPPRYNETKIPDDLKDGFVGGQAADDNDTKSKLENDPENVDASQVKSASTTQSGGLNDIVNMLGNGVQYIIGTVYTSEYIMGMFSNAAPELEPDQQRKYDASTFEYNRVTTLRNAVPVGKDQEGDYKADYENLRLGYFYNAEVEYILFGCDVEEENVNKTQLMLEIILLASNYLQVRNNDALKGIVNAAAAAGMSIGIPSIVTRFLMYTAFAVTETAFDMFYLMRGYEIPALSTKGELLFMMNLADSSKVLGANTELMISYEFYLRLRVMLAVFLNRGPTMQRMANLIQLNINYTGSDKDKNFRISEAYTTFKAKASAKMPYWFMTMAMMGNVRSDSKWFTIPEHEITASY